MAEAGQPTWRWTMAADLHRYHKAWTLSLPLHSPSKLDGET
jgi:hypothetical protein